MWTRLTFSAILLASATQLWAQSTVKLELPTEGPWQAWISSDFPKGQIDAAAKFDGKSYDLPLEKAAKSDKVFVWHLGSGNMAATSVQAASKVWKVVPADFKYVGKVLVQVEGSNGPASVATVNLDDGRRTAQSLIGPDSEGVAEFYGVSLGTVTVSAQAISEGKQIDLPKLSYDLLPNRSDAVPTLRIKSDAALAQPKRSEPETTEAAPVSRPSESNPALRALGFLVVLAGLGALLWYGWSILKRNPTVVKQKLQDLGVAIPEPPTDDPAPPVPVAPQPPQKIILDDAQPTPVAPFATVAPSGTPRLVAADGDAFDIPEGQTDVGREATGLGLPGETTVSRRHAQFERQGSAVVLRDLESTNGTFVNGVQISGDTVLKPGDAVQFGAVRFRYEG